MWQRRLFTLTVILSSLVLPAGATDPFFWKLTDQDGDLFHLAGDVVEFQPATPGAWDVELTVTYLHWFPPGTLYSATATGSFAVIGTDYKIFVDGFETGNTAAWSQTQGETS